MQSQRTFVFGHAPGNVFRGVLVFAFVVSIASVKSEEAVSKESRKREIWEKGRIVFDEQACWRCHELGTNPPPGNPDLLNAGPALNGVGNRLTRDEIRDSILNPGQTIAEPVKEHLNDEGQSKMPPYAGVLSADEIVMLVEFLALQKGEKAATAGPVDVSEETFESEVLEAEGLVLLDFWAEWCFPCREIEPVLETMAREFSGRIKICRINVDEEPELVADYVPDNIFPCLILMREGRLVERRYGADPKMEIEPFFRQWISAHLSPSDPVNK